MLCFSPFISYVLVGILGLYSAKGLWSTTIIFQFFVTATFPIFFYYTVFVRGIKLNIPGFVWAFIIYFLYRFSWSFFNGEMDARGIYKVLGNNIQLAIVFILIIIYNIKFTKSDLEKYVPIIKGTIIIAAVVSVMQVISKDFLSVDEIYNTVYSKMLSTDFTGNLYTLRRYSIFAFTESNEYGLSFVPLLSVFLGYAIYKKEKNNLPYILCGMAVCFLSNSRYVMIGFLIVAVQYILIKEKSSSQAIKNVFSVLIVIFFLVNFLQLLGYDLESFYKDRLFSEGSIESTTRYLALMLFFIYFPQTPIFGTGVHLTAEIEYFANAGGSSQIHVGYLSHLVSYGLVGSIILFSAWIMVTVYFYKHAKKTGFWGSFFGWIVFLWANATLVQYSILYYGLFFCFIFDRVIYNEYLENLEKKNFSQIN